MGARVRDALLPSRLADGSKSAHVYRRQNTARSNGIFEASAVWHFWQFQRTHRVSISDPSGFGDCKGKSTFFYSCPTVHWAAGPRFGFLLLRTVLRSRQHPCGSKCPSSVGPDIRENWGLIRACIEGTAACNRNARKERGSTYSQSDDERLQKAGRRTELPRWDG